MSQDGMRAFVMRRRWWLIGAAISALALGMFGCNAATHRGMLAEKRSPEALSALLSPYYRVTMPEGGGPHPVALLFSGCDGPKDNLDRLAAALAAQGWGAMIVDSHAPRGMDRSEVWRLVCSGVTLPGAERAADVAVAIADARAMPGVDPRRIALVGASHGGWAVLDLLALAGTGDPPWALTEWPGGSPVATLAGVTRAVLYYPYCGFATIAASKGWRADVPVLMILVEGDRIADETDCAALAARMDQAGRNVTTVSIPGVTHGFDQQEKALFSTLTFDEAAAQEALRLTLDFIGEGE
jgi:dienelactone hydrolase